MPSKTPPPTKIDQFLTDAGWVLQDRHELDRHAGLGVAEREFSLTGGFCDYRLFVGGKAAGVIEAKRAGVALSGVADQAVAVHMERQVSLMKNP